MTDGHAAYEIVLEQARVVRQIFAWVGWDRLSIRQVCRRLQNQGIRTATGRSWWDPTTVWSMLQNPAYKGMAAFGKTRSGPMRPRLRPQRGAPAQPRRAYSTYDGPVDEQIPIPVPAIVEPDIFDTVQEQLQENRRRQRERRRGARYLLQGLLVCGTCGHAYYGQSVRLKAAKGKQRSYAYYRCIGNDADRFGGQRLCGNKSVRTDLLEPAVWQDVCSLLQEPQRITREHERRMVKPNRDDSLDSLKALTQKVKRGMGRLIDAYQDGLIDRVEFEPRLRHAQDRLHNLNEQIATLAAEQSRLQDFQLVVAQVETFAKMLEGSLEQADWSTKRQVIRTLVKQIEIGDEAVKVVYRIGSLPFVQAPEGGVLQHCVRCYDSSYLQIVRWEGPLGKFTYLADKRGANYGLKNGDTLKASIIGNVITVYINGVEKAQVKDDTHKTGNPGIGAFLSCDNGRGIGSSTDFGFTSFTARGLGGNQRTNPGLVKSQPQ